MTPKQRIISAIKGYPVDRVPVATYNFHPFEIKGTASFSREPAYRPMLNAISKTSIGIICKVPIKYEGEIKGRIRTEHKILENATLTITYLNTPKGELRSIVSKPKTQPAYQVEPFIKEDRDLEKYLSLSNEPLTPDLSIAKDVYKRLGDKGVVYVSYEDPLFTVSRLFKFEDFVVKCMQQFSLIKALVDREFRRIKIQLKRVLEEAKNYDFLFYSAGPEIATPPMLPPQIFQKLVTPYHYELGKMIREAGHLHSIHCHGKVKAVFDQFLEIGNNVLEPLEPPPQGDITLKDALNKAKGRMCLMGYIQDQDLYTFTPVEIRTKVRSICQLVKGKTGYIMTTTATPYMFPPPQRFVRNYVEFVKAAEEYGSNES